MITDNNTTRILLGAIVLLACGMFIVNLGNHYLWQDEAQTALISKTILSEIIPHGYDGKNYFSQEMGAEYGDDYVWRWHTWLQFYLVSASFLLFGINTLSARLPFALFGIATVVLVLFFAKSLWKTTRAGVITSALLMVSVPFLILSRQCRYYSIAAFFSMLSLYAYTSFLENKKYSVSIFIFSSTLLFHTHYIYCMTLFVTVLLHALLCHRNIFKKVLIATCAVLLINLPWIVWFAGIKYSERYATNILDPTQFLDYSQIHFYHLTTHVFSPLLLLIPLGIGIIKWIQNKPFFTEDSRVWKNLLLLIIFIFSNIILLSLCNPAPFFRYLAPLIPVACMITGCIINSAMNQNILIGPAVMAILIFNSPISDYLYEITHDYNGPVEGIVEYLKKHGKSDDIVAITYGDMPVKFYTDMRVVGGFTGEDLSIVKKANWVIVRKYIISRKGALIKNTIVENTRENNYQTIEINYPDIPFENRESPARHRFRTDTKEDRVIIYRKLE